jgi:hypothetical protein
MTITVTAPNGATVDFPDGTDHATINGVMAQNFHQDAAPAEPISVNDVARSTASGVPIIGGLLNKADAATNAALAPLLNPLFDEKNQLQGETFADRYAKSLAMQEGGDAKFAAQHPYVDTGAKIAGATGALIPAVAAAPGLFGATGGMASQMFRGGLSNAALGGADAAIRGQDPLAAAGLGGMIGVGAPPALAIAKGVASPFISNIMARLDPEGFGRRQVARGIIESGRPTADIAGDVANAANEGQGVFTVADAMGNSGQRMLSTVARAPGEGRTDVVNALEGRQAGQGRRVSNALAEGFNAPETAAQTEARLTAARGAEADAAYGAVRNDAGPVDVTGAIAHIDRTIGPGADQMLANPGSAAANDSVESALLGFRNRLARVNPDDFQSVQRIRGDMSDAAQNALQSGYGNKARLIGGAVRQLDTAMENASAGHLAANRNFAQASRNIEAVQTGREAATRGRMEDTIPRYQGLTPEGQGAFRSGYVDPLIANTQGAAFGANKARPLLNDAFQAEAGAMAPGNPLMQRRIGREQTMFETRNHALGGSRTFDNAADSEALGIDPSVVWHVISGNWGGAVRSLIHAGNRPVTGNTPQVRKAVADILLQNGMRNFTPASLDRLVGETVQKLQTVQRLAQTGARAASGAAVVAPTSRKSKPPIFARARP